MKKLCLLLIVSLTLSLSPVYAQDSANCINPANFPKAPQGRDSAWYPKGDPSRIQPPVIKKITEGVFQVGNVTVNKNKEYISVKGAINMHKGVVEYLACGALGKLHESVLVLHAQPYFIQVAMLLLGLEPGNKPLDRQGGEGVPQGDPVDMWVSWRSADKGEVRMRAEELVFNIKTKKPMQRTYWVYTGSEIVRGKFMAQYEQSVIATYHDPYALIDQPLSTGTDDTLYYANTQTVPPKGTPITLIIKPASKKKKKSL
jgi:hypothetical protein